MLFFFLDPRKHRVVQSKQHVIHTGLVPQLTDCSLTLDAGYTNVTTKPLFTSLESTSTSREPTGSAQHCHCNSKCFSLPSELIMLVTTGKILPLIKSILYFITTVIKASRKYACLEINTSTSCISLGFFLVYFTLFL